MNLYDRVSKSKKMLSTFQPGTIETAPQGRDGNVDPEAIDAGSHLRMEAKCHQNKSVPVVTCAREEDKGILPSSSGNNISVDIIASRAQVTTGTNSHSTSDSSDRSALIHPEAVSSSPAQWDPSFQAIIDWFLALIPPTEPFYLQPHMHVVNPGKFFESLKREIETGPRGVRARLGTLQSDLKSLRSKFGGNCENTISPETNLTLNRRISNGTKNHEGQTGT